MPCKPSCLRETSVCGEESRGSIRSLGLEGGVAGIEDCSISVSAALGVVRGLCAGGGGAKDRIFFFFVVKALRRWLESWSSSSSDSRAVGLLLRDTLACSSSQAHMLLAPLEFHPSV
jgi:hypothetical protein